MLSSRTKVGDSAGYSSAALLSRAGEEGAGTTGAPRQGTGVSLELSNPQSFTDVTGTSLLAKQLLASWVHLYLFLRPMSMLTTKTLQKR